MKSNMNSAMRFFFIVIGSVILLGIWLTGFDKIHWLLYLPVVFLYLAALVTTSITQLRIAQATQFPRLAVCAAVILAAGLGPALMIVSFTPFVAQVGIQYWFLAGALHGVASRYGVRPVI